MINSFEEYFQKGCGRCKLGGTPECKVHRWPKELKLLRKIVLSCGLTEEIKWSVPCYTYQGKNVLILAAFKDYCGLSFFKGVLLSDEKKLLHKAGENSYEGKLFKFTDTESILKLEEAIREYIFEAIEIEKAGIQISTRPENKLSYPEEFLNYLEKNPKVKTAFEQLTPGRKRGWLLHFSSAKQSATRQQRIEKSIAKIMEGKGFHD